MSDCADSADLEDEADAILVRARMLTTSGETIPFSDVLALLDEEPEGFAIYG